MTRDKQVKNFLLVGTYCGLNKGDRIMQLVAMEQLASRFAGDINILCPFPEVDEKFYSHVTVKKSNRRNLPWSLIVLFILWMTPRNFRNNVASRFNEASAYLNSNVVLDLSGDMLTEDYGPHVGLSHSIPLLYAFLLDKEYWIVAQSVGPFRLLKKLYGVILRNARGVLVRESISYKALRSDFQLDNLRQVSDLSFLMKPVQGKPLFNREYFCFCPSSLLLSKFAKQSLSVERQLDDIAKLIKSISEKYELSALLIPHVLTPNLSMDDADVCRELANRLGSECCVLDSESDPDVVKGYVAQSQFVIAYRMHAALAAIAAAVPVILVGYSHKAQGIMRDLELEDYLVENDEYCIARIEKLVDGLALEKPALQQKISDRLEDVEKSAQLIFDCIETGDIR